MDNRDTKLRGGPLDLLSKMNWRRDLQDLSKYWVTDTPEHHEQYQVQMGKLLECVYAACFQSCGDYEDEEIPIKAIDYLETDLTKFDPARGSLYGYIYAKIKLRMNDARRYCMSKQTGTRGERSGEKWMFDLSRFEGSFPNHGIDRDRWVENVADRIEKYYEDQFKDYSDNEEDQKRLCSNLRGYLLIYDVHGCSLYDYVQKWVKKYLPADRRSVNKIVGSIDQPIGESKDGKQIGSLGDTIAADIESPENVEARKELLQYMLSEASAYILNFQNAIRQTAKQQIEQCREEMCYTEHTVFLAINSITNITMSNDIIRAIHREYLGHFSYAPNVLSHAALKKLVLKTWETISGEGSGDTPIKWRKTGYLEARVPIHYLKTQYGLNTADSVLSNARKQYSLNLKKLINQRYGSDDAMSVFDR